LRKPIFGLSPINLPQFGSGLSCTEASRITQPTGTSVPALHSRVRQGEKDMLNDREKILTALREKPLKIYEVMKRANLPNQEACQSLLLKMRDEGAVKFDIHKGNWHIG
jgi:hypothetical protein